MHLHMDIFGDEMRIRSRLPPPSSGAAGGGTNTFLVPQAVSLERRILVTAYPDVGDIAPDFELPNLEGDLVRLSDFRGSKVVLFIWGSW